MDGFYVFQTIRSVLNWHIHRISSGIGKAWNMPEYRNTKLLLYPIYSKNCLSISDYDLGSLLPRISGMTTDRKQSNPLTGDEIILVTAHGITNIKFLFPLCSHCQYIIWKRLLPAILTTIINGSTLISITKLSQRPDFFRIAGQDFRASILFYT